MTRRIFFHHIQKTAGTSLYAAFLHEYGPGAVSPQIYGMPLAEALRVHRDRQVIAGHVLVTPGTALPPDFYSLTILRHPVERYLSHLFFNLRELDLPEPPRPVPRDWWDRVLELQRAGRLAFGDFQVESLYRYAVTDDLGLSGERKLSAALEALERFTTVGIVEDFEDVLAVVAAECEWRNPPAARQENTGRSRPRLAQVDAAIVARLEEVNALDSALFERGRSLWRKARRRALQRRFARGDEAPRSPPAAPAARGRIDMGSGQARIVSCRLRANPGAAQAVPTGARLALEVALECVQDCPDLTLGVRILDERDELVFGSNSRLLGLRLSGAAGDRFECTWRMACDLGPGPYRVALGLHPEASHDATCFHYLDPAASFNVAGHTADAFEGRVNLRPVLSVTSPRGIVSGPSGAESPGPRPASAPLRTPAAWIIPDPRPVVSAPAAIARVPVRVINRGGDIWPCEGEHPVLLSYHLRSAEGELLTFEGVRTALPHDVPPGPHVTLEGLVAAPAAPGVVIVEWDLVQEQVAWFGDLDPASKACSTLEVRG